ncbi:hypothetical protein F5Y00DRAFT_256147 [Daldinia vernicosa]|uniref:uncharacterized protein n=1 Tax=Daldinia vernicosa TaxID=114800 RepID=UPI002007D2B6|nr:uncharacterized protein F5Y00DRAFT_256147 [Daldinia vernicosa]KAI0844270.1 hypothetical protein F5Y00DRAFT_256147 [Daldinia vernicosa]
MAEGETLLDRVGIYDNLNEPVPSWNRPGVIATVAASMFCISSICIVYRLYIRFFVLRAKGWDDYFILLYLVSGLIGGISLCLAPQYGLGQHFVTLDYGDIQSYLKVFYVTNASYNMSTTLIKMSLLFQYLRVYHSGSLRTTCIVMLIIVSIWGAAYTFMGWVPCFPVSGYWKMGIGAKCYGFGSTNANEVFKTYIAHTSVNTILDMIVFAIPVPLYFRPGTARRTKLGLVGLIIMGAIVNGFTMWRLATLVEHRATTSPTFDPTWYSPISIVLGALEVNVASICASVPIFWPSLKARLDEIFVTREVTITLHRRSNRSSGDVGDNVELQRTASEDRENKWKRCPSRAGSESSQSRLAEIAPVEKRTQHYMDDFILNQVDPFRKKGAFVVESEIISDGLRRQKSKRQSRNKG